MTLYVGHQNKIVLLMIIAYGNVFKNDYFLLSYILIFYTTLSLYNINIYLRLVFSSHTTNDYILWPIFIGGEEHNNGHIIMIITTMAMEMKWRKSILLSRTVASDKYRPFDSSRNRKFYLPERKMVISSDFQPVGSHSHFWHKTLLLYAKITCVPSPVGKITTYSYYSYCLCARRKRSNKILLYNPLIFFP